MSRTAVLVLVCTLAAVAGGCGKPDSAGGDRVDAGTSAGAPAALPRTPSPPGASVAILSPRGGDVVTSPLRVVFDIQGMGLAPAGDATPDTGHHHLLIDAPTPDFGVPLPTDDRHLHFGKAQTEAEITLAPGEHTLQLVLGDANHVPHDPPVMSAPITITVQ